MYLRLLILTLVLPLSLRAQWTLTCTPDVTQQTDHGRCGAAVYYPVPVVSKSTFVSVVQTQGQRMGTIFGVGATLNTYEATDKAGVKQECSFYVKVIDKESPVISCPHDTVLWLDSKNGRVIYDYDEPAATDNCTVSALTRAGGPASGTALGAGIYVISYNARDNSGNMSSYSWRVSVAVKGTKLSDDLIPPLFERYPDIRVHCDAGSRAARLSYPDPTATDNGKPVAVKLVAGLPSGASFPTGVSSVTYMAQDEAGNVAQFTFNVIVVCDDKWMLNCPSDIAMNADKGACGTTVVYATPQVTTAGMVELTLTKGQMSKSFFKVGSTVNTFLAQDRAGTKQECSFNVQVSDIEKPTIECPPDTIIWIEGNDPSVVYNYKEPIARDNCSIAELKLTDGAKSGTAFTQGVHVISWSAKDASGNLATCSFTVTVKRRETVAMPLAVAPLRTSYGDTIRIRSQEVVNDCTVTIFVADDGIEDGDTVSIFVNDEEVIKQQRLRKGRIESYGDMIGLTVKLDPNRANTIVAKAWNVGTIPPNTMEIKVFAGDVLSDRTALRTQKPILRRRFECYPGLTDGMTLNCK